MKKNYFFILLISILSVSCSSSDDSSSDTNENTSINTLKIDDVAFIPGNNTTNGNFVITSYITSANNGEAKARFFALSNDPKTMNEMEALEFSIIYPSSQATIDGTYNFVLDPSNVNPNNMAQGSYIGTGNAFIISTGTIKVSDLGSNKFRLEFSTSSLNDFFGSSTTKTLTGSYEGTFAVED